MTVKKVFKIIAGALVIAMLGVAALFASVFIGNAPLEDGRVLNSHGVTVNDGYVGSFLLPMADGEFGLIDCGNDLEAKAVLSALQQRGGSAERVTAIFLTHAHPDHIAGCRAFPNAAVYAFPEEIAPALGQAVSNTPMGRLAGAQKNKTVKVTNVLMDGESVQLGGGSVRAFKLPGHTAGSAAFLVNGVLYLGDSLTSVPGGKLIPPPWMFSEDRDLNFSSVKALVERIKAEQLDVQVLALSHTGALAGTRALEEFVSEAQ